MSSPRLVPHSLVEDLSKPSALDATQAQMDEARLLGVIVQLVQQATQIDVSHYKDSTFRRQLDRRLKELGIATLSDYVEWLERDPAELQRLQQSLLISVTRFFRDPEVFARLRELLVDIAASKPEGEALRIWVPGCATGEEAYTIAILVAEALGERLASVPVRLFATDIDQNAIAHARAGLYPPAVLEALPPELAQRYFVPDENGVRPAKFIRDLCVFAQHDLLSQPPFVHLDLISCRNVMIYFQGDIQAEILAKFHHALRPLAWLLLGQSESVGGQDGLYEAQEKQHKLFRRRAVPSPRLHDLVSQGRVSLYPPAAATQVASPSATELRFHQQLLKRHAPPSVLVDPSGRVLHLWGDVDRYLRLEGGSADFSLTGLCLPALRHEVKTLVHLAASAPAGETLSERVELLREQQRHTVVLSAQPVRGELGEVQGVIVGFDEQPGPAPATAPEPASAQAADHSALREELAMARERLHAMVQQLEQARDERQSLHEALQASSEELQSSNEELQASNEELTTLNEQLHAKSEELSTLNEVLLNIERSMQMAMVVLDPQLRVQRFNPLAVRIFGLLGNDVGRPLLSVPCSLPLEKLPEQIAQVIERGETLVSRVDQGDRHYVMQIAPLRDARAHLTGVILSFTDVAELRAAEAERSRLAAIVTSSEDAIIGKTLSGIITSWNPAAERLYGYTAAEAIGQPMLMVFPPEAQAEEAMLLSAIARGETVAAFDTVRLHKDGRRLAVSVALSPIRDGDGHIVGISKIARDISERQAIEQARQAEAVAAAASRAKSEFLANMSHEIRTPLNAVLGLAQLAQRQHANAPVADTFAHIVEAGQHLLGVINDVLDFSKIEAGKLELHIGRVDVTELLDKALGIVSEAARSKGLLLRVSRDPALAEAYSGDPTRLAQLLINLLTNAVKFTDAGRVELTLSAHEAGLAITVSDTGQGMSEDMLERLFRPFEQGDASSTRRVGGTGLGLSICKRLVELMKGRIQVHSAVGQGSRFEVWLPLRALVSRTLDHREAMPEGEPGTGRLQGLRVLVAEDHPVNQMVLEQLLAVEGAEMTLVANGALAVEAVRAHAHAHDHFDLVLCDIEMPVMDGYEATRQIRALVPLLPVVGLTAHAFEDARRRGEDAGMVGYVSKPYMIDALVQEIRRHARTQAAPSPLATRQPEPTALPHLLNRAALAHHYRTVPDFVPRLLQVVRQTCAEQPALLTEALQQGQGARLRQLAHGVAGMAANLLLPELRALAHRLEHVAELDLDAAAALVSELNGALAQLGLALQAEPHPDPTTAQPA
ncbi:CheR family methyltransferase [Aquabacterium sp.]|uniref:CheR family methyltransferase n=1 Tax=Aquabacterium sp. TaxID=1872578 RepID=UPI0025C29027|nr:CheR family methyltransferase [Aquabacterium sp.]